MVAILTLSHNVQCQIDLGQSLLSLYFHISSSAQCLGSHAARPKLAGKFPLANAGTRYTWVHLGCIFLFCTHYPWLYRRCTLSFCVQRSASAPILPTPGLMQTTAAVFVGTREPVSSSLSVGNMTVALRRQPVIHQWL